MSDLYIAGVEEFRNRFPIFREKVYINSCSKGALSDLVVEAIQEFLDTWRFRGSPWEVWGERVAQARAAFANLIGAEQREIAVSFCASTAINAIASALEYKGRSKVVLGTLEFPTMAHIWLAQRKRGAQVVRVNGRNHTLEPEDYAAEIDENTLIIPMTHVCYENGFKTDIKKVIQLAHSFGAYAFVDAYQSMGTTPINVKELDVDFLVSGCLKYMLGLPGIAFLYVKSELIERLEPCDTGWQAQSLRNMLNNEALDYAEDARRFQSGTQAAQNAYAALAGMQMLQAVGLPAIEAWIGELTQAIIDGAIARGMQVLTPTDRRDRGAMVAIQSKDPAAAVAALQEHGVIASWRGSAVRLSVHYYNDMDDVEAALRVLESNRDLMVGA